MVEPAKLRKRTLRWAQSSQCFELLVLRLIVVGDDCEVIVANARQILFGLNRLKDDAHSKFFTFLSQAQSFFCVGERLFCCRDLVGERLGTSPAGYNVIRNLISHLVSSERGASQARLAGMKISEIEEAARP